MCKYVHTVLNLCYGARDGYPVGYPVGYPEGRGRMNAGRLKKKSSGGTDTQIY